MGDNTTDTDYTFLPTQPSIIGAQYNVRAGIRLLYLVTYSVSLILGLPLNAGLFVALLRNKPKKACRTHVMGLALSHILLCSVLPLYLVSAWKHFSWDFGTLLCKLGSYIVYVNMFNGTTIITFWHLRWRVPENFSGRHVSGVMVLLSWIMGAALATPSLLSREVRYSENGYVCVDNYDRDQTGMTMSEMLKQRELAVVLSRVALGQLLPLAVITVKLCVKRRKLRKNNRHFKSIVLCPVTVAHFLCWAPVLWLSLVTIKLRLNTNLFPFALPCSTALSIFNSCIFPIICTCWKGKKADQCGPVQSSEEESITLQNI